MPELKVSLSKLENNARLITQRGKERGMQVFGVTKCLCGAPEVARAMLAGGCAGIADSRLENIRKMREAGITAPLMLLRLPSLSRAEEVVELCDISLNSEGETLKALSAAAVKQGKTHEVLLMVDMGDLREGVWPAELMSLVGKAHGLPGLKVWGIGTNLTCYGGVIPDSTNMSDLLQLAHKASEYVGYSLEVSGGNSSSLKSLFAGELPSGITNLRLGESILLGTETVERTPIPGASTDACLLSAEIVELQEKPSIPVGQLGQDAFGGYPIFEDRGVRRRAILAIGRQDVVVDGLTPVQPEVIILGASSDHLIVDVHELPDLRVGDRLEFVPGYGATLALSTSGYVKKVFI